VGEDIVSQSEPRSVIDRVFGGQTEESYSAPFADVTFYEKHPLGAPGRHLLGTDILGRDVLYRTLKGARVALLIGGFTSAIAIPLALLLGIAAGYFGGRIDDLVFFVMSTLASIPSLLLLIAIVMALGRGTWQVCVALGITSWVGLCRVSRGETLKLRELDNTRRALALRHADPFTPRRPTLHPQIMFALLFSGCVTDMILFLAWPRWQLGSDDRPGARRARARPVIYWNIASVGGAVLVDPVNRPCDHDIFDPRTTRSVQTGPARGLISSPRSRDRAGGSRGRMSMSIAVAGVALVGESGCGKTTAVDPRPCRSRAIESGRVVLCGRDLATLSVTEMRAVRGAEAAMIFQEPMTSLNPVQTVGAQVVEAIRLHERVSAAAARARCIELFERSAFPTPTRASRTTAPALGRAQAARDDRDGALDAAEAPDRRRADHRARRDDPGADPRSPARDPRPVRNGDPLDQPQPRRRERAR
jgi:peptide/nickel transport system permease protein